MIRATRAERGQARGVLAIYEAADCRIVLNCADKALLLADLAAQPRQDPGQNGAALGVCERRVLLAAERLGIAAFGLILRFDIASGFFDQRER
jgi:hypothetical protein